ncbi:EFR1 family ferrodoxin [Dielma fastidiosa]|uniref:Flavodoxin-like protein n=1 Tax=Dielma fastidiosa TaxID=1034346 RepID=A0A318KRR5_9FIRM|nr:EFR1 family ferrodoxin [Dielma fastidiosa]PXX80541.1 flavodoxin-like protein [Dielma fastidiosa]
MILYFSGTGNSEYAAQQIAAKTDDECLNLFTKIRSQDTRELTSQKPWVIVAPTYAWRIPRIVEEYLHKTKLNGSKKVYFVLTCGGAIGNAEANLKRLCADQGYQFQGCAEVIMPENYIALYSAPNQQEALKIIEAADALLARIAEWIKNGSSIPAQPISFKGKVCSQIINPLFYSLMVKADKFYAKADCVSCGQCVNVCLLNNIRLVNGKPQWGKDCTHCMACICRCPVEAIEYGKHTEGLNRYTCPKKLMDQ